MKFRLLHGLAPQIALSAAIGCGSSGSSTPSTRSPAEPARESLADAGALGPAHVISHGGGSGAAAPPASPPETTPSQGALRVPCGAERGSVCTKQYQPVCAEVDTGIRCIQAPCPSSERRTFGNACEACAERSVAAYTPGACPGGP